jgi:hypothetical protein
MSTNIYHGSTKPFGKHFGHFIFSTSEECAWRAFYLYYGTHPSSAYKFFHFGLDPVADDGPSLFGSIFGKHWRLHLPRLNFWTAHRFKFLFPLYQTQQRFWSSLDGRHYYPKSTPTKTGSATSTDPRWQISVTSTKVGHK